MYRCHGWLAYPHQYLYFDLQTFPQEHISIYNMDVNGYFFTITSLTVYYYTLQIINLWSFFYRTGSPRINNNNNNNNKLWVEKQYGNVSDFVFFIVCISQSNWIYYGMYRCHGIKVKVWRYEWVQYRYSMLYCSSFWHVYMP